MPSIKEAEAGDSEVYSFITQAEVTEVVWKLLSGKAPGVDEICLEYLKSSVPTIGGSHSSASMGKSIPGYWRGEFGR